MSRRTILYTVLAALTVSLGLVAARPALSAEPVRIMPLGDSITGGPGCWRAMLWDRLQRTGHTNIDFVGTLPGGGCGVAHDGDNEGHGGYQATGIANQNQLPGWLSATRPDVVLMHLGTNDVWNNVPAATIIAAFDTLLTQMRASNPNMKVLVAQIVPMTPSGCTWCPTGVTALNNAIPGWAASRSTAQSPVTVVDQYTGFNTTTETSDGVHPNDAGFQKMSDRWYPALVPLLGGTVPTSPATTTRPATSAVTTTRPATTAVMTTRPATTAVTTTRPATTAVVTTRPATSAVTTRPAITTAAGTSSPAGGCAATFSVGSQWPGGFQAQVTVTNRTAAATSAWTVTYTLGSGQQVTQSWNATVTQSGTAVTAKNVDWNGALPSGGSTSFGFLASSTGTVVAPAVTCSVS